MHIPLFIVQITLWILFYGEYVKMPWWVAWSPMLLVASILLVILAVVLFFGTLWLTNKLLERKYGN
jgi:hypothetical protein